MIRVCEAVLTHGLQWHSCAVLSSGTVKCWGNNDNGQVIALAGLRWGCVCVEKCFCAHKRCFLQLGVGTIAISRLTPVDVVGLGSGVANIALGTV